MKEIDFNIEDNWDFEEFDVIDLKHYIGKEISLLNELVGKRVKLKRDSIYLSESLNRETNKFEMGTVSTIYSDTKKVHEKLFHVNIKWDNLDRHNYRVKDLELC